jgi:hypothetical protein
MSGSDPCLQLIDVSPAAKRCLLRDDGASFWKSTVSSDKQGNIERAAFRGTQILRIYGSPKVSNKEMNPRIISSVESVTI